ncbi:flavodoxin [Clostridium tagluense]|uniref:Flavodoxin n=1 Tax=Clostridium tagluense TaxID=360422 RepID=A0A401UMG7_9CLOT|nr:flavodoxin [Clostridium tagluense]MBW9155814.1 flavodoxin [Clostridium tagluense]MCB2299699.1 flavodoxin [Clostridium tagluense]MCB2309514.1 flavodoxin [Clostridium tagluense]MCB2314956.1 flavodoxin [Clostridium tagluense]MCB2319805.1 flavodoxin [Clostridium tagluense]
MKNVVIIYWSGTGNTEAMAEGIMEGAKNEDSNVRLLNVGDAKVEDVINANVIAFGCPSMGAEQLEESEMEPFIESIASVVSGKNIVLFGSYGWGNGEWMTDWQERMEKYGANVIVDGLIINNDADKEGIEKCKEIGALLSTK